MSTNANDGKNQTVSDPNPDPKDDFVLEVYYITANVDKMLNFFFKKRKDLCIYI